MVGTISPVVYRDTNLRQRGWLIAVSIYTLGSVIGGSFVGIVLGSLGAVLFLSLRWAQTLFPLILGIVAIAYSLHELHLVTLPHPQRKQQVPSYWRLQFHPYVTAGLFGVLLGTGITTFIPISTFYILGLAIALYGSPVVGLLIFSIYGVARASLLWLFGSQVSSGEMVVTFTEYMDLTKVIVRQFNGFALAMAGAYLLSMYLAR